MIEDRTLKGSGRPASECITASRRIWLIVPTSAPDQAGPMPIFVGASNHRACTGPSWRFHQRRNHSQGHRPAAAATMATAMAPGSVCSQGWAGSPVKTNNTIGSRSISTFASANTVQEKCCLATPLDSAPVTSLKVVHHLEDVACVNLSEPSHLVGWSQYRPSQVDVQYVDQGRQRLWFKVDLRP